MKQSLRKIGILCVALLLVGMAVYALAQTQYLNLAPKELVIKRGFTQEARDCIECHAKKIPGTVASWKTSRMSHAGISC